MNNYSILAEGTDTLDVLSLRDLPLALAFGIACLWFYQQTVLEFVKNISRIVAERDALLLTVLEERRTWTADQRADRAILIDRLERNTEAQLKNATQTHNLRTTLTPVVLVIQQYFPKELDDKRRELQRKRGGGEKDSAA